jgi:hypothetical protein
MTSELTLIKQLINDLTDDEDLRQELWLHFLSGHPSPTFIQKLEVLSIYRRVVEDFHVQVAAFIHHPLPPSVERALEILAPIERQIIYLLICGLSPEDIAKYKDIGVISVYQTISSIRSSPSWRDLRKGMKRCSKKLYWTTKDTA